MRLDFGKIEGFEEELWAWLKISNSRGYAGLGLTRFPFWYWSFEPQPSVFPDKSRGSRTSESGKVGFLSSPPEVMNLPSAHFAKGW